MPGWSVSIGAIVACPVRPHRPEWLFLLLLVRALLLDGLVLVVLHLLDARALFLADRAVGRLLLLGGIDAVLPLLQPRGLALGEIAGLLASFDALFLGVLALVDALGGVDFGR